MSEGEGHDGRRTVGLYMPFTASGVRVTEIVFDPCTFGHLLRWNDGKIEGAVPLLMELANRSRQEIEMIRHPDDTRVFDAFLRHVHPQIAEDIQSGRRPISSDDLPERIVQPASDDWGASPGPLAPGPLDGYDGFAPEPEERPIDFVPGLDT